jgi:hypothetical protein
MTVAVVGNEGGQTINLARIGVALGEVAQCGKPGIEGCGTTGSASSIRRTVQTLLHSLAAFAAISAVDGLMLGHAITGTMLGQSCVHVSRAHVTTGFAAALMIGEVVSFARLSDVASCVREYAA